MPKRKKVLLVLNTVNDYRVETYNMINEVFDFTVGYNLSDETVKQCNFKKIKFETKKIGPFSFFGCKLLEECKKYDAVIISFDIHNFEFAVIPFMRHKYKLLTWSIGFRCSYSRAYDVNRKHELLDYVSYRIMKAADANVMYMEKAREFWANTNLDQQSVFVAPNTTSVVEIDNNTEKNSILFVGTLYKSKGVDKLIRAYKEAISSVNAEITLDIVGKGNERDNLMKLAADLGIGDRVKFHGPIYDEHKLSKFFEKALVCVSPTQAGLTVPKSMGYGVPVITRIDAITGGEIYHITPDVNGIVYRQDDELPDILKSVICDYDKYIDMGGRAKSYYVNEALPKHQAQGVIAAINYALGQS